MNYLLWFRDKGERVGGPVLPGQLEPVTPAAGGGRVTDTLVGCSQITFLIHGYNVSRDEGLIGLLRLAGKLPAAADGAVVAVLWPGDSPLGALSYPFEGNDADDTADMFSQFIETFVEPGTPLNFIAHSLGCRVAMETVARLADLAGGDDRRYPVRQVCLMAAAVDDFSLAAPDTYRAAVLKAGRVSVLSSVEDEVLRFAYPAGDLFQSFFSFFSEAWGVALGYRGPVPLHWGTRVHPVPGNVLHEPIPEVRGSDHGDYIPDEPPNPEQLSAGRFANHVISGDPNPRYI